MNLPKASPSTRAPRSSPGRKNSHCLGQRAVWLARAGAGAATGLTEADAAAVHAAVVQPQGERLRHSTRGTPTSEIASRRICRPSRTLHKPSCSRRSQLDGLVQRTVQHALVVGPEGERGCNAPRPTQAQRVACGRCSHARACRGVKMAAVVRVRACDLDHRGSSIPTSSRRTWRLTWRLTHTLPLL